MKRMIVNYENLQTRIALTDNDRIEEYYIERQGTKRVVGSIYKGRIRNLEPSLQAAFVDIGLEKNAFLHYWDMIPATKELLEGGSGDDDDEIELDDDDLDDDDDDQDERQERSSRNKNRRNKNRRNNNSNESRDNNSNDQKQQNGSENGGQESRRRRPGKRPEGEEAASEKKDSVSVIKRLFSSLRKPEGEDAKKEESPASKNNNQGQKDQGGNKQQGGNRQQDGGNKDKQGNQRKRRQQQRPQKKRIDLDEIPKKFQVNSEVVVQVSKGMIGDKGPRVTTNLSLPGRFVVLLPNSEHRGVSRRIANRKERQRLRDVLRRAELPKGMGVICRTAGQEMDDDKILQDIQQLVDMWEESERMKGRRSPVCIYQEPTLLIRCLRDFLCEGIDEIVLDSREAYEMTLPYVKRMSKESRPRVRLYDHPKPVFEYFKLDEQISNIFRRKINLPSGAELCIDETEALIAIDINSSKSRGGKDHPETILNTNMEAAEEIGRQLKLRNIGGLVVIDFIDMRSRKHQKQVLNKMRQVLNKDRAKSRILPISRLGLMEMTRQREHASLQDAVFETCSYCHGKGLIKSSTTISVEIQRGLREAMRRDKGHRTPIRVIVHPRVLERLRKEDSDILEAMENEFGGELSFRADLDIHQEEFYFVNSETGKEI